jgi:hypothetical protein
VGCEPIGTLSIDGADGALVRLSGGNYARCVGRDYVERLDTDQVELAIQEARERPPKVKAHTSGRPVGTIGGLRLRTVSLDDDSVTILRGYGDGNLSAGIRKAAQLIILCGG